MAQVPSRTTRHLASAPVQPNSTSCWLNPFNTSQIHPFLVISTTNPPPVSSLLQLFAQTRPQSDLPPSTSADPQSTGPMSTTQLSVQSKTQSGRTVPEPRPDPGHQPLPSKPQPAEEARPAPGSLKSLAQVTRVIALLGLRP